MLTLVSALVLLSPQVSITPERAQQYLEQYHVYRVPGQPGHGLTAPLPLAPLVLSTPRMLPPAGLPHRIYRVPGQPGHGKPALLPLVPAAGGTYFNFQEGPASPVVRVYSGPIPSHATGATVQVKKR